MKIHLISIGIIFILLALVHVGFPTYFKWKTELKGLSLVNKQMMEIHTLFIAIMVAFMGVLCVCCPDEILTTSFGKKISFGMALFWGIRLLVQFFGYSPKLWKGKTFETIMHILFTILWIYVTYIFSRIAFSSPAFYR